MLVVWTLRVMNVKVHTVHIMFVDFIRNNTLCIKLQTRVRVRGFFSPLTVTHASVCYWSPSFLSISRDPSSGWLINSIAIPPPKVVYSWIHLCFPYYWCLSQKKKELLVIYFLWLWDASATLTYIHKPLRSLFCTAAARGHPRDETPNEMLRMTGAKHKRAACLGVCAGVSAWSGQTTGGVRRKTNSPWHTWKFFHGAWRGSNPRAGPGHRQCRQNAKGTVCVGGATSGGWKENIL